VAVETGPDLGPARDAVFELMSDVCVITFAPASTGVLDPDTGDLVRPPSTIVYGPDTLGDSDRLLEGRCRISRTPGTGYSGERGDEPLVMSESRIDIPWDAPTVPLGSILRVVSSLRDPQLVDQEYTIVDSFSKTMLIQRTLHGELVR
jgi:hypothetical protein